MELNPYLTFNGNCRAALAYYKDTLNGNYEGGIKTFADGGKHMKCKSEDMDKIMHIHLKAGNFAILASDNLDDHFPFIAGNNFSLSLSLKEEKRAVTIFDKLAKNGKIIMPLSDAFWGGKFGMLVDQFDIQWMISCSPKN